MQITPTESAAEEVSFEWSNRKISSTDSKIKTEISHSIIYKGWCEKACWIVDERMKQKKKTSKPNALVTRNLTKDADSKFLKKSATKRFCPDFVGQFSVKTLVSIILSSKIQIAMKCRP